MKNIIFFLFLSFCLQQVRAQTGEKAPQQKVPNTDGMSAQQKMKAVQQADREKKMLTEQMFNGGSRRDQNTYRRMPKRRKHK